MASIGERLSKLSPAKLELVARELDRAKKKNEKAREPIAIVGMGCRFPGEANSPRDLWDLLVSKRDVCSRRPEGRGWAQGVDVPGYYLKDPYRFDAELFGISPREVRSMDPQHRLLLELSWQSLEDAGVSPRACPAKTGVFVGLYGNDYAQQILWSGDVDVPDAHTTTGTNHGAAVGRIAHLLGLTGPALCFDTACSSSLVAIHEACTALRQGACELALAGGVNLILSAQTSLVLKKANMLSDDGRSKTFDDSADGYGRGEGGGLIVLKRLSDAQAAGDSIRAVIRGSHVNHDGRASTLTAPNARAQAEVIRSALGQAGVSPEEIGVMECHGTGTPLGDPIEVRGLRTVFSNNRESERPLFLTAVKSSLGHLEAAAGVAGVMKMVLALQNKCVPPTLHVERLNPKLEADSRWMKVATDAQPWADTATGRKAGISSFGFGGTNAHLVLEEGPSRPESRRTEQLSPGRVLTLSAATPKALRSLATSCAKIVQDNPAGLDDARLTLNLRAGHAFRVAIDAASHDEAVHGLNQLAARDSSSFVAIAAPRLVFMFTGQGSQFPGMGQWLFENVAVFRQQLLLCEELLQRVLDRSLTSLLFGPDQAHLGLTQYAQPALFAFELALSRLWQSMGVEPAAVIGHSVGEFVAAHLAGVFDLETALSLVAERGRLMGELPSVGGMLALRCSAEGVQEIRVQQQLDLAAVNGPEQVVLSGALVGLEEVRKWAQQERVPYQSLDVSHAFHSSLMDPIVDRFARKVEELDLSHPTLPYFSNVTGELATDEVTSGDYWARHLRDPVLFAQGLQGVRQEGFEQFLEVGPRPILTSLARAQLSDEPVVASLGTARHEQNALSMAASKLFVLGADIDWSPLRAAAPGRNTELSPYPFQGESLRHPAAVRGEQRFSDALTRSAEEKLLGVPRHVPGTATTCFLREIIADDLEVASQHRLEESVVVPGAYYVALGLAAARRAGNAKQLALEDVQFRHPLALALEEKRQLVSSLDDEGMFQVESSGDSGLPLAHAQMRVVSRQPLGATPRKSERGDELSDFYEQMAERGFGLGPEFRWLHDIRTVDGVAHAKIVRPSTYAEGDVSLHPGFVDSCFQALAAAAASLESLSDGLFVPVSVDSLYLDPNVSGPLTIRAEIDKVRSSRETLIGNIVVSADSGTYLSAERLCARPLDVSTVAPSRRMTRATHEVSFVPAADEEPTTRASIALDGFNAHERDAFEQSAHVTVVEGAWLERVEEIDAVIFNTTNLEEEVPRRLQEALELVRTLVELPGRRLKLYLATCFAHEVVPGKPVEPYAAAWASFARCVAFEHPELWGGHIDGEGPKDLSHAMSLSIASTGEATIAVRDGTPYVARLVAGPRESIPDAQVERNGSYLVTGGLGALGREVAKWLVDRDAGRVVLVGRSGPSEEQKAVLDELRGGASAIEYLQVDCSDDRLIQAIAHAEDPEYPWRGVVHAAGVLRDGALVNQTSQSFERVMAPKVQGVNRILAAPGMSKLDWCVFFSSAAALLGSPGQSNYAFANGYLDGRAEQLSREGVRAVSIGFGPFGGTGMATRTAARSLELMAPLAPTEVGRMVEWALTTGRTQVGVFDVDLEMLKTLHPLPRFLEDRGGRSVTVSQSEVRSRLSADDLMELPENEATEALAARLAQELAIVLGRTDESVSIERSLHSLGLDSLTSLEFKSSLEKSLNVHLAISDLLAGPSLLELSAIVLDQLRHQQPPAPTNEVSEIEDLDDSQVAALLSLMSEESTDVAS